MNYLGMRVLCILVALLGRLLSHNFPLSFNRFLCAYYSSNI